jgi:hypothetical protein
MARPFFPLLAAIGTLLTVASTASAQSADPARAIFATLQSREKTFDVALADLYCETALIRNTFILPNGQRRTMDFPAELYQELIRSLMPTARARGEYSTFSEVRYAPKGNNVRVTATRYSILKKYSSPFALLIGPCKGGEWAVLEQFSESQP